VRRAVLKAGGVLGQSTNVVQATTGYSTLLVLHGYRNGDQFGFAARAGPSAEANLLCQQSVTRARGRIPSHREGSPGSSILSAKTSPLLPELHRNSDHRLSNSDVASKMVRWAVELSEFDVQYELRGPIKG